MAASSGTASCPRAALFFSLTLLGVKRKQDFTPTVKIAYKQTLARMAPGAKVFDVPQLEWRPAAAPHVSSRF